MSSLVSPADLRTRVETSASDPILQQAIDTEEAEIIRRFGAHYADDETVTETLEGDNKKNLYLRRRASSITSIVEDDVTLASTGYRLWGAQGRIERLPKGSTWGDVVRVDYTPEDDNDLRFAAVIDLVRIALQRTAMKSENVAGEYSYSADDWETARAEIFNRLALMDF